MTTKHTAGPWIARGKSSPWVQTPGAQGAVICHVNGDPDRTEEQAAADAALLAAAPDLLAALRQMIDAHQPGQPADLVWSAAAHAIARAAIERAEGRS